MTDAVLAIMSAATVTLLSIHHRSRSLLVFALISARISLEIFITLPPKAMQKAYPVVFIHPRMVPTPQPTLPHCPTFRMPMSQHIRIRIHPSTKLKPSDYLKTHTHTGFASHISSPTQKR
jgi:hypothetical protein